MMPGFRHRNRPTKMHDKGGRCFHLNSGNDHCYDTHKVIAPAGIAKYSAHCTFGYRRQAFQGEVPTWERRLLPLRCRDRLRRFDRERHQIRWQWRHLHAAGLFLPRHRRRQKLHVGGGIPRMSSSGAAAAGVSWISLRGEGVLPALSAARAPAAPAAPRGGFLPCLGSGGYVGGCSDIFPRRRHSRRSPSGGGDRWHTCKRDRSRTTGCSGCVAYATRIRPFPWSWSSYWRTFSDGAGAGEAYWWHTCKRERSRIAGGSGCVA